MEKKQIYLRDQFYNYSLFEYETIEDVRDKLDAFEIKLNRANIGNRAKIGYAANIGNAANIGDDANIGNRAKIGYAANIGNAVQLLTGFYINGSVHAVTYCGNEILSIGCYSRKISEWKERYKAIGKAESYKETQVAEYYNYILMAEMFHNANYLQKDTGE